MDQADRLRPGHATRIRGRKGEFAADTPAYMCPEQSRGEEMDHRVRFDGVAKLADLGLIKGADYDSNLTKTARGLGTPQNMAPEQFLDAKNVDARCDVYGLGATLYRMVTGELPFEARGPIESLLKKSLDDLVPPKELVPELSERVNRAILRVLLADVDRRPGSCREFIEALTGRSNRRESASAGGLPTRICGT